MENAYARLICQHASGVHEERVRRANMPARLPVCMENAYTWLTGLSGFTEVLRRDSDDGEDQLLGFDRFG